MKKPFVFKGTPGPWVVNLERPFTLGGDTVAVEALTPDGKVSRQVAECWLDTDDWPNGAAWQEDAANARLIAASRELLEFTLAVPDHYLSPRLKAIREVALQKVQGGTHEPV